MTDEGYIKFKAIRVHASAPHTEAVAGLNEYRRLLYGLGLIGAYPDGVGYGNISQRLDNDTFLISGSATGRLAALSARHYALVMRADVANNTVYYSGQVAASSESMSHAVIYEACPEIHAVIHVHHVAMWQRYVHQLPTTPEEVLYGSPDMAEAILWLLSGTKLRESGVLIPAGHEEGVFAFGETLEQAYTRIITLLPM
jgi:L-ribulose-5-phosphate 4-epimerase